MQRSTNKFVEISNKISKTCTIKFVELTKAHQAILLPLWICGNLCENMNQQIRSTVAVPPFGQNHSR